MLSPSHNVVGERGEGFTVDMRSMKMTCFGAHPDSRVSNLIVQPWAKGNTYFGIIIGCPTIT